MHQVHQQVPERHFGAGSINHLPPEREQLNLEANRISRSRRLLIPRSRSRRLRTQRSAYHFLEKCYGAHFEGGDRSPWLPQLRAAEHFLPSLPSSWTAT
jgi:hypothetical protein